LYNLAMPKVPRIIASRRRRRAQAQRSPIQQFSRFAIGLIAVLGLILAVGAIVGAIAYADLTQGLPSPDELAYLLEPPNGQLLQPTRLYDRSGEHLLLTLENPHIAERRYLPLDETESAHLPTVLVEAVIASLDPDFWQHPGYSLDNLNASGATIAQKLVAELLLWGESPGLREGLRERLLAAQVTAKYGREQVLEWYLNAADFGHHAYGADAAARVYFDKPAEELTLSEAAMLAAILPAPAINPIDAPGLAAERQGEVLQAMLDAGAITGEQAQQANADPLSIVPPAPETSSAAPAFTDLMLEQLAEIIPIERLYRGGLRIYTTLDYDLQLQIACVTSYYLGRLSGGDAAEDLEACPALRLLPSQEAIPTSLIDEQLAAGALVLDPSNGQVLALVGDASEVHTAGSLLTPFAYLTAFTRGFSPASLVWDIPSSLPASLTEATTNPDGVFHGPVRMRTALANDYLTPALQLIEQLGLANVRLTAEQMGLKDVQYASGDNPLESTQVSLLSISQAYATLANQGALSGQATEQAENDDAQPPLEAATVLEVCDYMGQSWLDWREPQQRPVISAQLAYLVNDVLSDEISRQDSLGHPNLLEIGRPAAAKLGWSPSSADAWTLGYTPQRLVSVWVGTPVETPAGISPLIPAQLWNGLLKYALADLPSENWQTPLGISQIEVCEPSGLLPTDECPSVVSEVFIQGNEPTQGDTLYRSFLINSQTGRLATVFTPPELVEQRVYLVIPPEAETWASQAGLPLPPEDYDVIVNPTGSENAALTSPAMFAYISGRVNIMGSATGSQFSFYRLQVGEGLNPRQWLQIGSDSTTPVTDGLLGTWDTSGLNGLYALQLQVVGEDQTIETAIIQVTVDNQPPELALLSPQDGQTLDYDGGETVTFLVQASDNLGIERVEFYVDNRLISTLAQSPYAVAWTPSLGDHTLKVRVADLAGNTQEASLSFQVHP